MANGYTEYDKTPEECIQVIGDSSYQGLSRYYAGIDEIIPYKKALKKAYNKAHSKRRISVRSSLYI